MMSEESKTQQRCGLCVHYLALPHRDGGICKSPLPIWVDQDENVVYSNEGADCPCWKGVKQMKAELVDYEAKS